MSPEGDRMGRAGDYVLGLMDDKERERAERDLEFDPAFRDAVVHLAERMRLFGPVEAPTQNPDEHWKLVAARLAELPQMRPAGLVGSVAVRPVIDPLGRRPVGTGLYALRGTLGLVVALALAAAFALGVVVGRL
jgi:hypothetical protein